ncbi:hypothetical protein NQZ68_008865 [Dissostichus eleginoides]|nr:hypothetical protein NQZ68_008865 [Dissostichus eleginoides]
MEGGKRAGGWRLEASPRMVAGRTGCERKAHRHSHQHYRHRRLLLSLLTSTSFSSSFADRIGGLFLGLLQQ